jgi:hypothetical protein
MKRFFALSVLLVAFLGVAVAETPATGVSTASETGAALVLADSWVYDAIDYLFAESGEASMALNAPSSVNELRLYLDGIPYDALSVPGKALYRKLSDALGPREKFVKSGLFGFDVRPELSLSASARQDAAAYFDFDMTANFNERAPLLSIPFELDFSKYVTAYTDLTLGEGYWASTIDGNYTSIPNESSYIDINIPKTAYLAMGTSFASAVIGRGRLSIGRTLSGSMILSDTADRLDYASLSLFAPGFRFAMTPVELAPDRFAYFHALTMRPLKFLSITLSEGATVNSTLDLRYLNPLMVFHSYAGWRDLSYTAKDSPSPVGTQFAAEIDLVPLRGFRLYGQFVMNQFQTEYELETAGDAAAAIPNSLGGTAGIEYTHPLFDGYLKGTVEGVYTNPWLYIQDNTAISWYSSRYELVAPGNYPFTRVNNWLGSPYGPDTIACLAQLKYDVPRAYSLTLGYRFICKGTNGENFFAAAPSSGTTVYYTDTLEKLRYTTPSGQARYQHRVYVKATWNVYEWLELGGNVGYAVMTGSATGASAEAGLSATFRLP